MAFSFIKHMVLGFDCPLGEEKLWVLVERIAGRFSPGAGGVRFVLEQRSPVSELAGEVSGSVEYWTAEGARFQRKVVESGAARPGSARYRLSYVLQMKSGFRLEMRGEGAELELPSVEAHLYQLRPDDFDDIHGLFVELLGEQPDLSFEPALATPNVEAALKAGYGAFARHLIDRAMEGRPPAPPQKPSQNEQWWDRLLELRESIPGRGSSDDS